MKKYIVLIYLSLNISLSAQNFVIGGKFSISIHKNLDRISVIEGLVATNNNAYSIGFFLGLAKLDFNFDDYDWAASYEDTYTKYIVGLTTYIYPLNQTHLDFLRKIYLSFTWAQISDHGPIPGGGYMFWGTCYTYPGSSNENIWIISSGYKIRFKSVNILLGIGYQHREYDLSFDEYGGIDGYFIERYYVHQIEKFFQIDIGLQFVF